MTANVNAGNSHCI